MVIAILHCNPAFPLDNAGRVRKIC